ncbi:MAG: RNA polymerase sigma factor [Patescibacteria group bacterium]
MAELEQAADLTSRTDLEIVNLILGGEYEHISEIMSRYQRPLFGYILRLLNFNRQDAEDVLSETFIKVYINLASFKQHLKFSSWLYRIAHNEAVNLIKKKSKYYLVDIKDLDLSVEKSEEVDYRYDLELILKALPVDDRNILILFYLEELSLKEIAEVLKITENNAAVKLNRARQKARKITHNLELP